MTSHVSPVDYGSTTTPAGASDSARRTRLLLACGAAAGPIFIAVALIQAATRTGFDPAKHPASLLSVGDLGWIQITNFIVCGLLFLASAGGMRRALRPGRAATWGPRLIGAFGVALIAGGVLVSDPGLGFPPGTPEGIPDTMSWHGLLHAVAPVVGFLALSLACFVFARRSFGLGQRGWAVFSIVIGVVIQVLGAIPNANMNFIPLWAAMVLGFGWASAQAARLVARPPR
jgi:Protein of unknown function (DUF998)